MEPDIPLHILEQKISVLNTVGNISMLWWVTTVVLCVSILAGVWKNKKNLPEQKSVILLVGIAGFGFFLGVILYGYVVVRYLNDVEKDISTLANSLGAKANIFSPELKLFQLGMEIGTVSFAGVLILWIIMHVLLLKKTKRTPPLHQDENIHDKELSSNESAQQSQPNKSIKQTVK